MGSRNSKLSTSSGVFNSRRRLITSGWQKRVGESCKVAGQKTDTFRLLPWPLLKKARQCIVSTPLAFDAENTSRKVTIEILPEDVLIIIFEYYRLDTLIQSQRGHRSWKWKNLAYVCRTWRSVLLASSHYLGLRLFFTDGMPVSEILSFWPVLPIFMRYVVAQGASPLTLDDQDNIMTLLQLPTRLREIRLTVTTPLLEKITTLMQQPFSVLEYLHLSTLHGLVLPIKLGGGMPHLRALRMGGFALPAHPQLLLSAHNLVSLQLEGLPSVGYTLEALIVCLPAMTQLKTLRTYFLSPISRPVLVFADRPLSGFSVLPVLALIEFHGLSEYLESLLSGISAPRLEKFHVDFFNQLIFDTPQLARFIYHSNIQRSPTHATIHSSSDGISITLNPVGVPHQLSLRISCGQLDWQIPSIADVCDRLSPALVGVEELKISSFASFQGETDDMDLLHFDILDLFRPFRNVKRLCVTQASLSLVTGALRLAAGELAMVVLPELREIQKANHTQLTSMEESLAPFIAARQHSTHPVAVRTQFPFGLPPLARQGAFRQRRLRTTQFLSTVQKELPDGFRFRILVLGKRQSGKSALINAVFNVDIMAGVLGSQHDDANINVAFCPYNNNYLVVHEYPGFESGDAQNLQNIREFISYYTDANRSVLARLHAVWICVPISDAIESGLDKGVKDILAMKQVPVLIVFTKFDVLVSQVQVDIARGDTQMHEDPWTRAHAIYEASCRSFFHKDPRYAPASIFSEKRRYRGLLDQVTSTTHRVIKEKSLNWRPMLSQALPASPITPTLLVWSVAQRVNLDITIQASIEVGRSRYWRDLGSSGFTNHTLESCVNVIHEDIIKVWNFDDREEYLLGREFTAMMTDLVGDMARVGSSDISPHLYLNWTSTLMAPWTNGLYQNAHKNIRCIMAYIVDLIVILHGSFLTSRSVSATEARSAVQNYESSSKGQIHEDIRSFVAQTPLTYQDKDIIMEKIIDLIKQNCVRASS